MVGIPRARQIINFSTIFALTLTFITAIRAVKLAIAETVFMHTIRFVSALPKVRQGAVVTGLQIFITIVITVYIPVTDLILPNTNIDCCVGCTDIES